MRTQGDRTLRDVGDVVMCWVGKTGTLMSSGGEERGEDFGGESCFESCAAAMIWMGGCSEKKRGGSSTNDGEMPKKLNR